MLNQWIQGNGAFTLLEVLIVAAIIATGCILRFAWGMSFP
jgi:prepilin-type N-terminal cleavage/methylation domain-containing protein